MAKRKSGEGTWGTKTIKGITYKFYRNPEGKYFYGKTEKEINEKRKKYTPLKEVHKDTKKEYFGDYVLRWLLEVKGTEIKRHTLDGYEDCINGQLINFTGNNLSDIQVGALTTDHFVSYYNALAQHYSRSSIKKNYAILSQCIKYGNKKNHFSTYILQTVLGGIAAGFGVKGLFKKDGLISTLFGWSNLPGLQLKTF